MLLQYPLITIYLTLETLVEAPDTVQYTVKFSCLALDGILTLLYRKRAFDLQKK